MKQSELLISSTNCSKRATQGLILLVVDRISDVLHLDNDPKHLKHFTDVNSKNLVDPWLRTARVYFQYMQAHTLAAVSPNLYLCHDFHDDIKKIICPVQVSCSFVWWEKYIQGLQ